MTKHIRITWNEEPERPVTPQEQAVQAFLLATCCVILALCVFLVSAVR